MAEPIIAAVALMADSGLPCFGRGAPVANLRRRFHLEMSDAQAAAWMLAAVADAYDNWRTVGYDYIQVCGLRRGCGRLWGSIGGCWCRVGPCSCALWLVGCCDQTVWCMW